ncbi:MAG: bifunctional phosphoglucose/phosphomannose isomerase [Anaerolineae bacterium]|nr:bifunctional phosphoglucose/phosphomannose isomerase [Anaerolineae bacterium]
MDLNNVEIFGQLDAGNMLAHIDALPEQVNNAWAHSQKLDLPAYRNIRQIVICGMGGSSISGELLSALVEDSSPMPITVNRGYDLPAYVDGPETLVIALSHSGDTEETLSAAGQAIERKAHLLAITTGGKLVELAERTNGAVWLFDYKSPPRAAIGWLYGLMLAAFSRLGFADHLEEDIEQSVQQLHHNKTRLEAGQPSDENPAKDIASFLIDRVPVIWGSGFLAPVAYRWKTQINENAKTAAYHEVLPELDHNSVVGTIYPGEPADYIKIVQLISGRCDHPRVAIRQQATASIFEQHGLDVHSIEAQSESRLVQQFELIQLGDYVSFYLAMLNRVDPTPIPSINELKERLAQAG